MLRCTVSLAWSRFVCLSRVRSPSCVACRMGSLETGPSANTRNIGLRRTAVNPQRRVTAEMFGAGLTQSQTMASVLHDQGPLHAQHRRASGASMPATGSAASRSNRGSTGSRGPYAEGAPALSLGELHRAGRGSAVERGPAVSGPPANRAAVSWGGSGSVGHADPPLYDARPSSAASGRVDDGRGLLAGLRSERRPATTGAAGVRTGSPHDAPSTTGCHAAARLLWEAGRYMVRPSESTGTRTFRRQHLGVISIGASRLISISIYLISMKTLGLNGKRLRKRSLMPKKRC